MQYLGDYKEDETVYFLWSTNDADGASVTRTVNGTVSVYKDNGVTQSVAGVTDTEDFDSLTGIHACTIDLSADAFYATGADYAVVLSAATIDGQTVNAVLAHFSIENRFQEVDVVKWLGTAPLALSSQRVQTYVAAMASDVVSAAAFAQAAADKVWSTAARALTDKTGFSLSAAGIQAIWDKATSALTTVGSIGKLLVDNINATISSRATPAQVNTEATNALVAQKLDHLVAVADSDDPVNNSIIAKLAAKGATADWSSFNNTTDSQEALADYVTAISDLVYEPDASSTIATGTQVANTYASCAVDNGVYWQIADTGAGDGLDVICEFNLATTRRAVELHINGYFNGSGGPVEIYIYNYVSASWNKLSAGTPGTEMRSRANDRDYVFPLTVGNTDVVTSPGEVKVRFLTASSNAGDDLYLDYVAIVAAPTGVVLPEVIAKEVWEFDVEDIKQSAAGEYFAGHIIKRLVVLGTDVATANTAISFTLTAGITTDDAYNGMLLEVRDESSATRDIEVRRIVDWTSGRVVTVDRAYSFIPAVDDHVHITCGYLETMRGTDGASTHTAADVWSVATRTLTSFGTLTQDIWNKLTSALTTAGSIGKLLVDNINATISSRASSTNVSDAESNIRGADGDDLKDLSDQLDSVALEATVADLITRAKGLNAIYDSVALRALETTLTAIKGSGFVTTEDSLRVIRQYIDEIESGVKPPSKANFEV